MATRYIECPYCGEEIRDNAIVCRYCGQDLSLEQENIRLREKISSLERQISEITSSTYPLTAAYRTAAQGHSPSRSQNIFSLRQPRLVVLLTITALVILLVLDDVACPGSIRWGCELPFLVPAVAIPFLAGLWVGVKQHARRLGTHARLGILIGTLVGATAMLFELHILDPAQHPVPAHFSIYTYSAFLALVGAAVFTFAVAPLFVSGGLFGNLIHRWGFESEEELSKDITLRLVQSLGPSALAFFGTTITVLASLSKT